MINAIETIGAAISTVKDVTQPRQAPRRHRHPRPARPRPATRRASPTSWATWRPTMTNSMKTVGSRVHPGHPRRGQHPQVVDAVMNAEQSLQTAIAIRDKVVTAYLEIARMPI